MITPFVINMSRYAEIATRKPAQRTEFEKLSIRDNKPPVCPHCMNGEIFFNPRHNEFICNKCKGVVEITTPKGILVDGVPRIKK